MVYETIKIFYAIRLNCEPKSVKQLSNAVNCLQPQYFYQPTGYGGKDAMGTCPLDCN